MKVYYRETNALKTPLKSFREDNEEKEKTKMQMKIMLDPGATIPTRAHKEDAGLDLYARESTEEKL